MSAHFKTWQITIIVCFAYLLLGIFTMQVLNTLTVWPPAGIALAGMMIFGRRAWLGVALGTAFVVTYHFYLIDTSPFIAAHLVINVFTTTGNTLAALAAYLIIHGRLDKHDHLSSVSTLVNTFIFACLAIGVISAVFGVGVYSLVGLQWFSGLYMGILNWSISNALAAIVITPALVLTWRNWPHQFSNANFYQFLIVTTITIALCFLIFGPDYAEFSLPVLQPSLLLFPLLYSAIKLSPTSTSCLNMLVFFLAWVGSNQGQGYFYHHHPATAEVTMQFFFLFTLSAVLLVQSVFVQRKEEQRQLTKLLEDKVEARTFELEQAKQDALRLSLTDPLTDLYNRRGFFKAANQVFSQYLRHPGSCALLLFDLDKFKAINDQYGHASGDAVIQKTAQILSDHSRQSDICGRIGGEEFVIFLPMTDSVAAMTLAERIREDIAGQSLTINEHTVRFTASIGVSEIKPTDENIEELLGRADKALYHAKDHGRNQAQFG
ncbi:sensor domain-containing diguanylate cyclase [Pseudoalteromonas sp. GB56]